MANKEPTPTGFKYSEKKGGITITDYVGGITDPTIPPVINQLPVVAIGDKAFSNKGITSVIIPKSVTSIGDMAFDSCPLDAVNIPRSVTSIGKKAFSWTNLNTVKIPNSVTIIKEKTFLNNELTKVTIPNSVITIGKEAFAANNKLTKIKIPDSVTSIQDKAFSMAGLAELTIPDSVTKIGKSAFYANSLTRIIIPASVTHIGAEAFMGNPLWRATVINPNTSIGYNAFANDKSSVSLTNIEWLAIQTRDEIDASINERKAYVDTNLKFYYADFDFIFFMLRGTYHYDPSQNEINLSMNGHTLICKIGKRRAVIDGIETDIFPFTKMKEGIFGYLEYLWMYFGNYDFIPGDWDNTIKLIRYEPQTQSIEEDEEEEEITEEDEQYQEAAVDYAEKAFEDYKECIEVPTEASPIADFVYAENYDVVVILEYIGKEKEVVIPSVINNLPVTGIMDKAFSHKSITAVTIPDSVTAIGGFAFEYCGLKRVIIPNSVTSIGNGAFLQNRLQTVTIPDSITIIGYATFACNNLTSIIIPDSVTVIGDSAFETNTWLSRVTIGNSVTEIGEKAFAACDITRINIPASVTSIGKEAFFKNPLTRVHLNNHLTRIDKHAFAQSILPVLNPVKWMAIQLGDEIIADKKGCKALYNAETKSYTVDFALIINKLGGTVNYDQSQNELTLTLNNHTLNCKPGKTRAALDGKIINIFPIMKAGNTFYGYLDYLHDYFEKDACTVGKDGIRGRGYVDDEKIIFMPFDPQTQNYNLYCTYLYGSQFLDGCLMGGISVDEQDLRDAFVCSMEKRKGKATNETLREWWGIYDRSSALFRIKSLYDRGHRRVCKDEILHIDKIHDEDKKNILAQIADKWGDRNIIAWDLSRAVYLAVASYGAGYITFDEYVNLSLPAARLAQKYFSNWEEYEDNRMDGFRYWRNNKPSDQLDERIRAKDVFLEICRQSGFAFDQKITMMERDAIKVDDLRLDSMYYHVTLRLNARLQSRHRGTFYEEPIDDAIEGFGFVYNQSTLEELTKESGHCDVEIYLSENTKENMDKLLNILDEIKIPSGSLLIAENLKMPVGELEGFALYLDAKEIPNEACEGYDVGYAIEILNELLDSSGSCYSYFEDAEKIALYFYGDSFDDMKEKITDFLDAYPLCQNSKVQRIA